jgi:hypothetical protein
MKFASLMRRCIAWSSVCLGLAASPVHAIGADVLILDSSVTGGMSSLEALTVVNDLGLTVDLVSDATWASMTAADFASYRAIVVGDPTCGFVSPVVSANACLWNAQVDGNVIIISTDPVYHQAQGGAQLVKSGIAYAAADPTKTGAYICISCEYSSSPAGTPVTELAGFCGGCPSNCFTTTGALGCFNNTHIVATHPALTGLTDADLANWSCSVHGVFDTWAPGFIPLAIALDPAGPFTAGDGTVGYPYIVARGDDLEPIDECAIIKNQEVKCNPDGTYSYTFDLTNISGKPIQYLLMDAPAGFTVSPSVINLGAPLPDGATTTVTLTFSGGAPGDELCFKIRLNTKDLQECCTVKECFTVPDCKCGQIVDVKFECIPGTTSFTYTFTLTNLMGVPLEDVYLIPISPISLTFTPDHFNTPAIPPFGSVTLSTTVTGVGAGQEFCFFVSLHGADTHACCALKICETAPVCGGDFVCPGPGKCCEPHSTPGCDDPACCEVVCAIDPTCCTIIWDADCVHEAEHNCPQCSPDVICGDGNCVAGETCETCKEDCGPCPVCPGPGKCCVPHSSPSCNLPECCGPVCDIDPDCCITAWDVRCVEIAKTIDTCFCPVIDAGTSCAGDVNFDGFVDGTDLGIVLAEWSSSNRVADINADGTVDGSDLGELLSTWGACTQE